MFRFNDPLLMPQTGETPQQRLLRALPLAGTPGADYVEKRGIPLAIANEAGVCYDEHWNGREAVVVPMRDHQGILYAVHGRYLQHFGKQNKMFTLGSEGGIIKVNGNTQTNAIILTEGLFDALSLSVCGYGAMATVGRWAAWLPGYCSGQTVFIAFDATRSGESETMVYKERLKGARVLRLLPPDRCKDWNTALRKRGSVVVTRCLQHALRLSETNKPVSP